jgi:hypothetical protein
LQSLCQRGGNAALREFKIEDLVFAELHFPVFVGDEGNLPVTLQPELLNG